MNSFQTQAIAFRNALGSSQDIASQSQAAARDMAYILRLAIDGTPERDLDEIMTLLRTNVLALRNDARQARDLFQAVKSSLTRVSYLYSFYQLFAVNKTAKYMP